MEGETILQGSGAAPEWVTEQREPGLYPVGPQNARHLRWLLDAPEWSSHSGGGAKNKLLGCFLLCWRDWGVIFLGESLEAN